DAAGLATVGLAGVVMFVGGIMVIVRSATSTADASRPAGARSLGLGLVAAALVPALCGYGLRKLSRPRADQSSAAPMPAALAGDFVDLTSKAANVKRLGSQCTCPAVWHDRSDR